VAAGIRAQLGARPYPPTQLGARSFVWILESIVNMMRWTWKAAFFVVILLSVSFLSYAPVTGGASNAIKNGDFELTRRVSDAQGNSVEVPKDWFVSFERFLKELESDLS
jgi:hypothetical protein